MRLAVLQSAAALGDVTANLGVIERALADAADRDVDVMVTPELFTTGYAPALVFDLDGAPIRTRLSEMAAQHEVALVASTVEHHDDHRFITATMFDATGHVVTHYRKAHLFATESEYFTPGNQLPEVIEFAGLPVALSICFDVEFPEFVRSTTDRGAEVLLVPTAVPVAHGDYDSSMVPRILVDARAMENTITIAYANYSGTDFVAQSRIAGPTGRPLAVAHEAEALIFATVHRKDIDSARQSLPYLSSRRSDLY